MNAARASGAGRRGGGRPDGQLVDFTLYQIGRALRQRTRYRYVQPRVVRAEQGFRIESPCCSRNVDPEGGLIDIAWLLQDEAGIWQLHARDHAAGCWNRLHTSAALSELLDTLCVDTERVFWP